ITEGDNIVNKDYVDNLSWNLAADGTAGNAKIKAGDTVTFKSEGDGLSVSRDGNDITYKLADNIATTDDGLTFAGDSGTDVDRTLGETLNIKGSATGDLTSGNIGVVADGGDTLNIKLAKDIDLGKGGS